MEENKQEWYEYAHGSPNVMGGRLTAQTDTDYLIFKCPRCEQGMLVTDYGIRYDKPFRGWTDSPEGIPEPKRNFAIVFEVYCGQCDEWDIVKITYGRLGIIEESHRKVPGEHFEHPGRWWRDSNEEGN